MTVDDLLWLVPRLFIACLFIAFLLDLDYRIEKLENKKTNSAKLK